MKPPLIDLRSDTVTKPSLDLLRDGDTADSVLPRLAQAGVRLVWFGARRIRAVTHLDVSRADVERAARIIVETLR